MATSQACGANSRVGSKFYLTIYYPFLTLSRVYYSQRCGLHSPCQSLQADGLYVSSRTNPSKIAIPFSLFEETMRHLKFKAELTQLILRSSKLSKYFVTFVI